MTAVYVQSEPLVARSQDGTVHVQMNEDTWAVFRTEAHYANWREHLDREEMHADLDAWQARFRSLGDELRGLRS